jgi:hypothetical protein
MGNSAPVILSANDATPKVNLGQQHVNYDLEKLFGPRAYVYVRNHESSAWTAGLAVRQRSDLFATEGTALTADANTTSKWYIGDASGPGAPFTTDGYVPDTLPKILYQTSLQTTVGDGYHGRINKTTSDIKFYLEDPPTAIITSTSTYVVYLPYAFILTKTTSPDPRLVGGVTQSSVSAGYYGWVQIAGWGWVMTVGAVTAVADGVGIVPGATAGYGKGATLGTDDALIYAIPNQDSAAAAFYQAAMIRVPGTPVM